MLSYYLPHKGGQDVRSDFSNCFFKQKKRLKKGQPVSWEFLSHQFGGIHCDDMFSLCKLHANKQNISVYLVSREGREMNSFGY